jgi:hypothetical protein
MKIKLLFFSLALFIFFSCNSNQDKEAETKPENQETSIDTISASNNEDSAITVKTRPMIWTVDEQNQGAEKMRKPEDVKLDTFSSEELVQLLNNNYPDIQMKLVKISHDTMYVKIPDSKKLTEQMGSTGAQNYMASATYTLTEFKNVKYINFNLEEGDHAGPGIFSRKDFKTLR